MSIHKLFESEMDRLRDLRFPIERSDEIYQNFIDSNEFHHYLSNVDNDPVMPTTPPINIDIYVRIFTLMKYKAGKDRLRLSSIIYLIHKSIQLIETYRHEVRIIGISGKMGSGKSLVSRIISESFNRFSERSFAENIRKITSIITGIDINETRTVRQKNVYLDEWDKTVGQMLQSVGGGLTKSINSDVWTKSLFADFDSIYKSYWVIDDVRFPSNIEAIKSRGGIMIRLEGRINQSIDSRDPNDESETALDNYDDFDIILDMREYKNDFEKLRRDLVRILGDFL